MAKDPAFLYYDGDAARDVSHMNRLERGCYFDIIQAQRKFGRLSEDIIKKVLGKDFDECWDSIKICLSYDNHMYFIEWLENSVIKRKEYSESRKNNRLGQKQTKTDKICQSYDSHMENENEIVIKDVIKTKKEDKKMTESHFEKFWEAYPKKVGKKDAKLKFMKLDTEVFETIMYALEWQTQSKNWQDGFIPDPKTYINGERWNDNKFSEKRRKIYLGWSMRKSAIKRIIMNLYCLGRLSKKTVNKLFKIYRLKNE